MSVGGNVIETIPVGDRVWINTRERQSGHECAIFVEATNESRSVSPGDMLWWQGSVAYWTPANKAFIERRLQRIGYSGVKRPLMSSEVERADDH